MIQKELPIPTWGISSILQEDPQMISAIKVEILSICAVVSFTSAVFVVVW